MGHLAYFTAATIVTAVVDRIMRSHLIDFNQNFTKIEQGLQRHFMDSEVYYHPCHPVNQRYRYRQMEPNVAEEDHFVVVMKKLLFLEALPY